MKKKKLKLYFFAAMALVFAAFVPSCDDDDDNNARTRNVTIGTDVNFFEVIVGESRRIIVSPAGLYYEWKSDNESVAAVNPRSGEVTGVGPGKANITVTFGEQSASVAVDVFGTVTSGVHLMLGEEKFNLAPEFVWTSSDPTIAEVVNNEIVTVSQGRTTVVGRNEEGFGYSVINTSVFEVISREELTSYAGDAPYTGLDNEYSWTSENQTIADVNFNSLNFIRVGETTLRGVNRDDFTAKLVNLVIRPGFILSRTDEITVYVGGPAVNVNITPNPADATLGAINWTPSADNIIAVSGEGTTGAISGLTPGRVTLSCEIDGLTRTVDVWVRNYWVREHIIQKSAPIEILISDFDLGGLGVAWNDSPPRNGGNNYRWTEFQDPDCMVDVEGNRNIGYTNNGEWLRFTITVADAGVYTLDPRIAVGGGGGNATIRFMVAIDDRETGQVASSDFEARGWGSDWGGYRWYYEHENQVATHAPQLVFPEPGEYRIYWMFRSGDFNIHHLRIQFLRDLD